MRVPAWIHGKENDINKKTVVTLVLKAIDAAPHARSPTSINEPVSESELKNWNKIRGVGRFVYGGVGGGGGVVMEIS